MAKKRFTVGEIKREAEVTLCSYDGAPDDYVCLAPFTAKRARNYCNKILFLCRQIEKLRKKNK